MVDMLENPRGSETIESIVIDAEVRTVNPRQTSKRTVTHRSAPSIPIPALCSTFRPSAIELARTSISPPSRSASRFSACASLHLRYRECVSETAHSDLMHLNGRSLLSAPFRTRRQLLHDTLPPYAPAGASAARWDHVKSLLGTPGDLAPIRDFMAEAISNRCASLNGDYVVLSTDAGAAQVRA
jgi:hypothetical protein